MLDIVIATAAVVLTAPMALIIAICIRLDSRGPVFFRQERVGRFGRPFGMLKFRTMVHDAEDRLDELWSLSLDPHWLHLEDDPRITRVGRWLRVTSLDELPQLLNVLAGEMSVVGPRPLSMRDNAHVPESAQVRTAVAPGITGLWQVTGRTTIPFERMLELDAEYARSWSLRGDLRLIMQTIPAVIFRRGAN